MALCLALNASASPPAKLGVGVFLPLSVPLPLGAPLFRLIPESLGAGGGAGFFLAGGAGGAGLARAVGAPFVLGVPLVRGADGAAGRSGAAGGVDGSSSSTYSMYADGAQPSAVPTFTSHQPGGSSVLSIAGSRVLKRQTKGWDSVMSVDGRMEQAYHLFLSALSRDGRPFSS